MEQLKIDPEFRDKLPPLTEETYFSPQANMAYMSASQYKAFLKCEAAALAEIRGEYVQATSAALLVGSYVDAHFSRTLPQFRETHPEIFKKNGELKADYTQAESVIERMESDGLYSLLMSGQKQAILTGTIGGVPFKCKIDSLLGASEVEQIRHKFPECADLFEFSDGCICDQKVMRDIDDVWDATERRRVSFIKAYGYDIQGAIYQALEGHMLPFVLAIGTKQDPPDLAAIHIPDSVLSDALHEVQENAPRFQRIKLGLEPPERCEKCAYCRATRRLTRIEEYTEE